MYTWFYQIWWTVMSPWQQLQTTHNCHHILILISKLLCSDWCMGTQNMTSSTPHQREERKTLHDFQCKKTRLTSDFNPLFSVTLMLLNTLASKMTFVAMTSQATHFQNILSLWWIVIGDSQDIMRKKKPILLIIELSFFS